MWQIKLSANQGGGVLRRLTFQRSCRSGGRAVAHTTCFARGMRSTAFPWAVVVLSAIWSGVHPVEVRVGGAAASPSQLKAFAAQVPAELYAALGEGGAAACTPQSDPFCGE